jgi:hypothetical protein
VNRRALWETQKALDEKLLVLLESAEHDRFVSHVYQSRREYRLVCERPGKGTKQIEGCIILTFQIAESLGFNCELRQREHLLRGNINRLSLRFFVGVEQCFPGPICNSSQILRRRHRAFRR